MRHTPDSIALRDLIEVQRVTQQRAAEILGCCRSTIERACRRLGLQTQRTGPRSGAEHPDWTGGRRLHGGYWYIWTNQHPLRTKGNYVAEHRLVAEATLGRYLTRSEVVHHINGDPSDNRPENLAVFGSNAEHLRHELTGRVPNWTPEGWAAMQAAVRRKRTPRGQAPDAATPTTSPPGCRRS